MYFTIIFSYTFVFRTILLYKNKVLWYNIYKLKGERFKSVKDYRNITQNIDMG